MASVSCPRVTLDVTLPDSSGGSTVEVSAGIGTLGSDPSVRYAWTASGGTFAAPDRASTIYECPRAGAGGPQIIYLAASRGPCTVSQQAVVVCIDATINTGLGGTIGSGSGHDAVGGAGGAAADAGAPPLDAGADHAGEGTTCGLDPTIDEGPACNGCTNLNCTTSESAKRGVPVTDGCHQLASDAERQSCQALYCCMRTAKCVNAGDPTACWCGTADPSRCANGSEPANGPCLREIQDAAGTVNPTVISLRLSDPTFALGGAMNLATCRSNYCAAPPSPACSGFSPPPPP